MSEFVTTLNFDSDFCVPEGCPRDGEIQCKVVCAACHVVDRWDEMLTFKVRLVQRITIKHGDRRCTFDREVVLKETVWFDKCLDLLECDVKAAVCKCVLNCGRVWCNGTVAVRFRFRRAQPVCPCRPTACDGGCEPCDPCAGERRLHQGRCSFACPPKRLCRH